MLDSYWQHELFQALLNIIVAVITLGLGWLIGQRLTVYWAIRQKRKELELAAVNGFYELYGEFFSVWKAWAYIHTNIVSENERSNLRWSLLERACATEGKLEAIFVKLSSERNLSDIDIEVLGKFRQAYQQLRESIRDDKNIGWWSQDAPGYLSFKRLSNLVALIILNEKGSNRSPDALVKITQNTWERNWILSEEDWIHLKAHFG